MTDSNAPFTLLLRLSNGNRMEVTVEGEGGTNLEATEISVLKVKESIAKEDPTIPTERQRLIYKGSILMSERTLSDYGIANGATLFLVKSAAPGGSNSTTSTGSPGTNPTVPSGQRTGQGTGSQQMPPSMMMNPFGQQRPNMGSGQMPDPQQMQEVMNSPAVQGLLDNPDLLGGLLEHSMQSSQMQELMDQNPELRQLYNDPAMIQQAIQMMRNPQHLQQVMRQQDLAMSQLENMPGGFSALSSMYRNVQEPMMEAQQASRESGSTNAQSRNSGGADGATGAAMPNPWGSPAAANRNSNASSSNNNSAQQQQANPFAAMMGGGGNNPFGGGAGSGGGMPNPWAAAASGGGGGGGMTNPWGGGSGASGGSSGNSTGMPGFPGMGGMPQLNMDQIMQMLENPMMAQTMNEMVQNNPDMIRTMLESQHPMLRQMFQGNPQMANEFIRNTFNRQNNGQPPNFGAMMGGGGMPFGMPPMGGSGAPGADGLDFSTLLQQFQNTGLSAAAAGGSGAPGAPPSNPADRYRNQLQQLYGMGFDDEQANVAALQAAHGNLNRAVDQLLSAPPPASAPAPAATNAPANDSASTADAAGSSSSGADNTPKDAGEKKND